MSVQYLISHLLLLMATLALYRSLLDHSTALKSLQREHKQHLEREKALGEILNSLRSGYNPNYQDMAVLEAVRGWEELAGLPHINDVRKDGESRDDTKKSESEAKDEDGDGDGDGKEKQDDSMWSAEKLEKELDGLVGTDHVSLLLEYEEHIRSPRDSDVSLCELRVSLAKNGANHMWCGKCLT
jgi:protein kinase C substrate 80K-H